MQLTDFTSNIQQQFKNFYFKRSPLDVTR